MRKRNKRGAGKIKIRRQKNTGLVVAIILILAAALFASQLNPNPTGKTYRVNQPPEFGDCYNSPKDPYPDHTTLTNCCHGTIPNYKWVSDEGPVVYC